MCDISIIAVGVRYIENFAGFLGGIDGERSARRTADDLSDSLSTCHDAGRWSVGRLYVVSSAQTGVRAPDMLATTARR